MWAIVKKELKSAFLSPIGYISIAVYLIIFSCLFYWNAVSNRYVYTGNAMYLLSFIGMPLITVLLTIKSFSEERSKDTEQLLFMSSRNTTSIVLGKFIANMIIVTICLICTFMYFFIELSLGNPSLQVFLVNLLGGFLIGAAYISFGMFVSSLSENQILIAVITLVCLYAQAFIPTDGFFKYLSIINMCSKFSAGIISINDVLGLCSFAITCIIMIIVGIRRRRI